MLSISLAFNLWPSMSPVKRHLARLDQAAIFLFIAGTYTPFLAVLGANPAAHLMTIGVWGAALVGIALKADRAAAVRPPRDPLYLAIGWSGIFVFQRWPPRSPPRRSG